MKHTVPFLTCEQIYCLLTAVSSLIFLIGCIEFVRHITKGRRRDVLIAVMPIPEMYAIAMYPNSAIPAAADPGLQEVSQTNRNHILPTR